MEDFIDVVSYLRVKHKLIMLFVLFISNLGVLYLVSGFLLKIHVTEKEVFGGFIGNMSVALVFAFTSIPWARSPDDDE